MPISRLLAYFRKPAQPAVSGGLPISSVPVVVPPTTSAHRIQEYPVVATGIAVESIETIVAIHSEQIHKTFEESGLDDYEDFEKLYLDVIKNFIRFAHLVPASENNHHIRAGGLVEHSLEVAFFSMRNAGLSILPHIGHCDDETRFRQPRWLYASWLTGLLHDAGKPFTDFTVVGDTGDHWEPLVMPLYDWCVKYNVNSYHCVWHAGRTHKEHDHVTLTASQMILTNYVKKYISQSTDNLWAQIAIALSSYNKREGYIDNSVRRADYESTEKDSRRTLDKMMGDREAPIQTHLIMAMRSLRQKWTVNKQNSQIWIVNNEVCLLWPNCIEAMIELAQERGHKVPSDANIVLHILESRGYVDKPEDDSSFMLFTPEAVPVGKLRIIRLSSPGHLYEGEPIPGSAKGELNLATHRPSEVETAANRSAESESGNSASGEESPTTKPVSPQEEKAPPPPAKKIPNKEEGPKPKAKAKAKKKQSSPQKEETPNKHQPIIFHDMGGINESPDFIDDGNSTDSQLDESQNDVDYTDKLKRKIISDLQTGVYQIGIKSPVFVQGDQLALKWPTTLLDGVFVDKRLAQLLVDGGLLASEGKNPVKRKTIASKKHNYVLLTKTHSDNIVSSSGLDIDKVFALGKNGNPKKRNTKKSSTEQKSPPPSNDPEGKTLSLDSSKPAAAREEIQAIVRAIELDHTKLRETGASQSLFVTEDGGLGLLWPSDVVGKRSPETVRGLRNEGLIAVGAEQDCVMLDGIERQYYPLTITPTSLVVNGTDIDGDKSGTLKKKEENKKSKKKKAKTPDDSIPRGDSTTATPPSSDYKAFKRLVWSLCEEVSLEGELYKWQNEHVEIAISPKMLIKELKARKIKADMSDIARWSKEGSGQTDIGGQPAIIFSRGVFHG